MATARRLYLYGITITSLIALIGGLQRLLVFVIDQLTALVGPAPIAGESPQSLDELSLAVSVVALAMPVWTLHWWAAERLAARGAGSGGDAASTIRAVHFLLVRQLSLGAFLVAFVAFVSWVISALLVAESGDEPVADSIALATIAGATWVYHTWLRGRDLRRDDIVGGAAAVARFDRHLGSAIGLVIAAFGTSDVIAVCLRLVADRPIDGAADWWQLALADAMARTAVGLGAFLVHGQEIRFTFRATGVLGEDDRRSRVRAMWMASLVLLATGMTIWAVGFAIESVVVRLLGAVEPDDLGRAAEEIVGPPLAAIPWIVLGWWVTRTASGERRTLGEADAESPVRLASHVVSFLGLLFASVGVGRLLGIVIEGLAGQPSLAFDDGMRPSEVAQAIGFIVAGGVPWATIWPRLRVPDSRSRTAHRAYLYAVIAASLAAGVPAAAIVLYNLLSSTLGASDIRSALAAIPIPIATVIVSGTVAGFHARLLRRDARADVPGPGAEVVLPPGPATEVALLLRVPAGSDPSVLLRDLRARLPAGSTLDEAATP